MPFQAATSYGTLRKIIEHQPKPVRQLNPDLPEWFERIVQRLMAKEPKERDQTAAEVAELLRQCLAHVEQPQLVPLPAALRPSQGRGSLAWRIAMSVGLISALVTGGWLLIANQMGSGGGVIRGGKSAEQAAAPAKTEAAAAVGAAVVEGYAIKVGKVADVSGLKMDVAFDLGQLGLQEQTQAFGGAGGGGFAGGGGGGGGGRFNKPSLGVLLVVEAPSGKDNVLAEISLLASAVDDQGRTLKTESTGPARIHFQEFERTAPGGQPIYFAGATKDVKALQKLQGELLLSPGRVVVAQFEGDKFGGRMTKRVGNASFVLESVTQNEDGIQLSVVCPPTKALAEAAGPQERFQAMLAARGVYSAEIEDNTGEVHRSQSGNSAGGGSGAGFGGFGAGGPPARGKQAGSSQTFRFAPLPEGRQIATIRVRMTERTGAAKAVPFTIENIPVR